MEHVTGVVALAEAVCDQFQIDDFNRTAEAFFLNIFGMDSSRYFLSDESELSDFCFASSPLNDAGDEGDSWVFSKIRKHYGIELKTTRIYLVSIFQQIEQARKQPIIH